MADVALIALGSNLGDRAGWLAQARSAIAMLPQSTLVGASEVKETAPFGPVAQGPYLNQMLAISTALDPLRLLAELHAIERALGRVRGERWGPRTIDLDVVEFGSIAMTTPELTLPHPGLADREFWQREREQLASLLSNVVDANVVDVA